MSKMFKRFRKTLSGKEAPGIKAQATDGNKWDDAMVGLAHGSLYPPPRPPPRTPYEFDVLEKEKARGEFRHSGGKKRKTKTKRKPRKLNRTKRKPRKLNRTKRKPRRSKISKRVSKKR